MRDGNFMLARQDKLNQLIPTQWILEAQGRWTHEPPNVPMTALAVDVAQGGGDNTCIASVYGTWFDEVEKIPGVDTPDGKTVAGCVVTRRMNGCTVVVDAGGGYGGATIEQLKDNGITPYSYKGSEATSRKTSDNLLGFANVRTEALWRMRELLDPGQPGGATAALPPSTTLAADLSEPDFEVRRGIIHAMTKVKVCANLGRSPDEGDAVVMANYRAPTVETHGKKWRGYNEEHARRGIATLKVINSRSQARGRATKRR